LCVIHSYNSYIHWTNQYLNVAIASQENEGPVINDPNFKAELVYKGIRYGINMTFLAPNDILVLEKDKGTVQRIVNGIMQEEPVLDVNVAAVIKLFSLFGKKYFVLNCCFQSNMPHAT
jgi:hypothetical protein